jgi:hypothetical protein
MKSGFPQMQYANCVPDTKALTSSTSGNSLLAYLEECPPWLALLSRPVLLYEQKMVWTERRVKVKTAIIRPVPVATVFAVRVTVALIL